MPDIALAWSNASIRGLVAAINPTFESQHPRGGDGQFITKGGWARRLDPVSFLWTKVKVEDFTADGKVKITRLDNGDESLVDKKTLYQTAQPKATLADPSKWTRVGGQLGSNPGGTFKDANGAAWYVKTPKNKLQVANEDLANRLYRAAGVPTPETAVSHNGTQFMSRIEDAAPWASYSGADKDQVMSNLRKSFVVDAWLSNWDAPRNGENTRITPDGRALRVDAGGSVMFRAQGGIRRLNPDVGELESMKDLSMYRGLTDAERRDGVERILAIDPEEIRSMVKDAGLPDNQADNLIARRVWLANHFKLALPESTPEGQKLLADLKAAESGDAKANIRAKIAISVQKLAPDTAEAIGIGAPVWVKNKNGQKFPDVGIITDIAADGSYNVTSVDGKIEIGAKPADVEVLRANFASVNSKYSTGEHVQVNDLVNDKTLGDGTVGAVYPLFAKVTFADGSTKVIRTAKLARVAQAGTHDNTLLAGTPAVPSSVASIGPLADVQNRQKDFPMVVWSLQHRATVMVLDYDANTDKAKIVTRDVAGNDKVMQIAASQLYDAKKVNKEAVANLPVKAARVPKIVDPNAPVKPKPTIDYKNLPTFEMKISPNLSIDVSPGDRIFKIKNAGKADIGYIKLSKNGQASIAGTKPGARYSSLPVAAVDANSRITPDAANNAETLQRMLTWNNVVDVTPPKYDTAAFLYGPKPMSEINTDNLKKMYLEGKLPDPGSRYSRSVMTPLDIQEGDVIYAPRPTKGGLEVSRTQVHVMSPTSSAYLRDASGNYVMEEKISYAPRIYIKRSGKLYDLGTNGENAPDPKKWVQIDSAKQAAFESTMSDAINHYGSPTEKKLPTGETVTLGALYEVRYDGNQNRLNRQLQAIGQLDGSANNYYSMSKLLNRDTHGRLKGSPLVAGPVKTAVQGNTASPVGAVNIDEAKGFKALAHRIGTSRTDMLDGSYDDQFHAIFNTEFKTVRAADGSTVFEVPDGTKQGDPYMSEFNLSRGGNQDTLALSLPAFKAIVAKTGYEFDNWRGVPADWQANALRDGDYYNGTGVYGNGTYTGFKAKARQYGSALTRVTATPGNKVIQTDEASLQSTIDISATHAQRQDLLGSGTMPSLISLSSGDQAATLQPISDKMVALFKANSGKTGQQLDDATAKVKEWTEDTVAGRVATAWVKVVNESNSDWKVDSVRYRGADEYYSIDVKSVTAVFVNSRTGAKISLLFASPKIASSNRVARSASHRLDKDSQFNMRVLPDETLLSGGTHFKGTERLTPKYNSGWWIDDTTKAIDDTGFGDVLRGDTVTPQGWEETLGKASTLDARVSFISDPGRWALAAGYDEMHVPSEKHNIFLHRAAFVTLKQ